MIDGTEEWRPVAGWESLYEVSSLGRVRSKHGVWTIKKDGIITANPGWNGYPSVGLHDGKRRSTNTVHKLVSIAFLGPKPTPKHEVDHINGNRTDPRACNLRWVTRKQNAKYAAIMRGGNKHCRGEKCNTAKLNSKQVRIARECRKLTMYPGWVSFLATIWGVTHWQMSNVSRGIGWPDA